MQLGLLVAIGMAFFVLTSHTLLIQLGRYDLYVREFGWVWGSWLVELALLIALKAYQVVSEQRACARAHRIVQPQSYMRGSRAVLCHAHRPTVRDGCEGKVEGQPHLPQSERCCTAGGVGQCTSLICGCPPPALRRAAPLPGLPQVLVFQRAPYLGLWEMPAYYALWVVQRIMLLAFWLFAAYGVMSAFDIKFFDPWSIVTSDLVAEPSEGELGDELAPMPSRRSASARTAQ